MPVVLLMGLLAVALALARVWDEIGRSRFLIRSGVYTLGAPMMWRDWGWPDNESVLPSLALLVCAAIMLVWGRGTGGWWSRGERPGGLRAALGRGWRRRASSC